MLSEEPDEEREVRFGKGEKGVFGVQELQEGSGGRLGNEKVFLESIAEVKLICREEIIDFL